MECHEDGECLVTHGGFCLFSLWICSEIKRFAGDSTFKTQTYNLQYKIGVVSFEFNTLEIGFLDNLNNNVSRHPLSPLQ